MILVGSKKLRLTLISLTLLISLNSCADKTQIKKYVMEGPTMGTQYKIIIKSDQDVNPDMVQNQIERILWVINNQMSTYDPKSEISTFNSELVIPDINSTFLDPEQAKKKENLQKEQPNHSSTISEHFSNVIEKSFYYYEVSDGMFDITVHQLYELWGFQGKSENLKIEPSKKEVDIALDFVGMDKLKYSRGNQLLYKNSNQISIDVNAIAKGYAVDVISDYIEDQGYFNYFIDIGGEIRVSSTIDRHWDIGIQEPSPERLGNAIEMVRLSNNSIATSGNYANFIEYINSDAKRTHIINPKTGYPLEIKDGMIASVSIVAPLCIDADALATTLMLLSKEEGLRLIESLKDTEAYIIYLESDSLYVEQSSEFKKYIYK